MARVLVLPKRSALVRFELNPAQTIVVGFATIVLAGAFLLSLPVASVAIETVGALILAWRWIPEFGLTRGVYYGVFHSISAFNNAGFDLMGDFRSLTRYVADPTVNLTVAALLIIGGLGFVVLSDLFRPRRYTLHMRVVLTTTAVLIVLGTTLILLLESSNAATLGTLPLGAPLLASFFQAVTPP